MNRFDGFVKYNLPNEFGGYSRNDLFWKKPKTVINLLKSKFHLLKVSHDHEI